jgi:hypothetical protein
MQAMPADKSGSYKDYCLFEMKELKGNRGKEQVLRIGKDEFVELGFRFKTDTPNGDQTTVDSGFLSRVEENRCPNFAGVLNCKTLRLSPRSDDYTGNRLHYCFS